MFARQLDPLAAFSSASSAADQHHRAPHQPFRPPHDRSLFGPQPHAHGVGGSSSNSNPQKRKHSLHFEPDFYAALDSSLKEHGEGVNDGVDAAAHNGATSLPSRARSSRSARPVKRAKKSALINAQAPSPTPWQDAALPPIPFTLPAKTHGPAKGSSAAQRPATPHPESQARPTLGEHRPPSPSLSSLQNTLHRNVLPKPFGFRPNSTGPSIIDLSSGEELVALHLGENERKRGRDGDPLSPTGSTESLREVFEYQDDGTLLPILDHAPAAPSPAKKMRMGKAYHHPHLRFLSEVESEMEGHGRSTKMGHGRNISGSSRGYYRPAQNGYWCGVNTRRKGPAFVRGARSPVSNLLWDDADMAESDARKHADHHQANEDDAKPSDDDTSSSQSDDETPKPGQQVLIRYQAKTVSFVDERELFRWSDWKGQGPVCVFAQDGREGKELVLYRKPVAGAMAAVRRASGQRNKGVPSQQSKDTDRNDTREDYKSNAFAEELSDDDDDGNMADDEGCENSKEGPLMGLEEKIMDMELD